MHLNKLSHIKMPLHSNIHFMPFHINFNLSIQPSVFFFFLMVHPPVFWKWTSHSLACVKGNKCKWVFEVQLVFWHCKVAGAAAEMQDKALEGSWIHRGTQTTQVMEKEQIPAESGKAQWNPHWYHKGARDQMCSIEKWLTKQWKLLSKLYPTRISPKSYSVIQQHPHLKRCLSMKWIIGVSRRSLMV